MISKDPKALLDALCAQYAAYRDTHPATRLHALIDPNALSSRWQAHLREVINDLPRFPLYQDTGLDDIAQRGPFLLACPAPDTDVALHLHRVLLAAAKTDHRCISWLWCEHDALALVDHLQTLLHARLEPQGQDVWLHFHQATFLPVLHRELPDDSRRYIFDCLRDWWCLDLQEAWVTHPGQSSAIPRAWDALPIPEALSDALQRVSTPSRLNAAIERQRPDAFGGQAGVEPDTNVRLRRLTPIVQKAARYGIKEHEDLSLYADTALLYGSEYDEHPPVQEALLRYSSGNLPLSQVYLSLGDAVWREVAALAKARAVVAQKQVYQATLRERGFIRLRVQLINETSYARSQVELLPPTESSIPAASLGTVKGREYGPGSAEIASAVVPIPGSKVRVSSVSLSGRPVALETVVTGDLPNGEGMGVAQVRFDRDGFAHVHIDASESDVDGMTR